MERYKLVYSTDPKDNKRCEKCHELLANCSCTVQSAIPDKITVRLQIEKAHRGGKTVTTLKGLPKNEEFLKSLSKELKQKCGAGGTYSIESGEGVIEIQGERRAQLRPVLESKGYTVKG